MERIFHMPNFYDSFEGAPTTNYVGDDRQEGTKRAGLPDASNANNINLGPWDGFFN